MSAKHWVQPSDRKLERRLEARAMTRREVITRAIDGQPSWVAAADIIGDTAADVPDPALYRVQRNVSRADP